MKPTSTSQGRVEAAMPVIAAALELYGAEMCLLAMIRLLRIMEPEHPFEKDLAELARARIIGALNECEAKL